MVGLAGARGVAQEALGEMESDAEPPVAAAAREARATLKRYRQLNPDLEY